MYRFFESKDWVVENPWSRVKMKTVRSNPEIIKEEEFTALLKSVNGENGWRKKGVQRRNFYKPWLKDALILGLYAGCRPSMIFHIKWKYVEGNFLKVPNEKINRLQGKDVNFEYTYITDDLAEFLLTLTHGCEEDYLIAPEQEKRESLLKPSSNGFTHFWRYIKGRTGVSLKTLRKTKLTREVTIMGDKAKYLNSHKSDAVKIEHYINQKEIVESMKGKKCMISDKTINQKEKPP
jgi:integrase